MTPDQFAASSTLVVLKTPAEETTLPYVTPGIDITNYAGLLCFIASVLNTAGTDPTLDIVLQSANDTDLIGTITYSGTGDGTITQVTAGADAVAETITITFSNATTAAVVGSVSGALGIATVGTVFSCAQITFMLTAGAAAFVNTDAFTIPVSARVYTTITGGTFAQVTDAAASVQRLAIHSDSLGKYLRAGWTLDGTDSPAFVVSIAMLGLKQYS